MPAAFRENVSHLTVTNKLLSLCWVYTKDTNSKSNEAQIMVI